MSSISLNHNWKCIYAEPASTVPAFTNPYTVDSLSDWMYDQSQSGRSAWLKHTFTLEPTDYCVNYVLRVAAAPAGTSLYLNDQLILDLTDNAPYEVDITLNIALGENSIFFCVVPGAPGHFGDIELHPIPCD